MPLKSVSIAEGNRIFPGWWWVAAPVRAGPAIFRPDDANDVLLAVMNEDDPVVVPAVVLVALLVNSSPSESESRRSMISMDFFVVPARDPDVFSDLVDTAT